MSLSAVRSTKKTNALAVSAKAAAGRLVPAVVMTMSRLGASSPAAAARPFSR
jgi:hypothetical protein